MTSEKEKMLIIKDAVEQLYHRYDAHFIAHPSMAGVKIILEFAKEPPHFICSGEGETFDQALIALAAIVASRIARETEKVATSYACLADLVASSGAVDTPAAAKVVKP